MKLSSAIHILNFWAARGRVVFASRDLSKIFDEQGSTLSATIKRLVANKHLVRAVRDVYVSQAGVNSNPYLLEEIALTLRRGEYNYISLESALSEWGSISQIPLDRITIMTTGRRGEYQTPFGVIEFTHTKLNPTTILANTVQQPNRPLRIASEGFAAKQLRRVGRNVDLLTEQSLKEKVTHGE